MGLHGRAGFDPLFVEPPKRCETSAPSTPCLSGGHTSDGPSDGELSYEERLLVASIVSSVAAEISPESL